jgi:hypothetical protein
VGSGTVPPPITTSVQITHARLTMIATNPSVRQPVLRTHLQVEARASAIEPSPSLTLVSAKSHACRGEALDSVASRRMQASEDTLGWLPLRTTSECADCRSAHACLLGPTRKWPGPSA